MRRAPVTQLMKDYTTTGSTLATHTSKDSPGMCRAAEAREGIAGPDWSQEGVWPTLSFPLQPLLPFIATPHFSFISIQ